MSTHDIVLLAASVVFLTSSLIMIVLGVLFDFWLEKRHARTVGQPLVEPPVPLPLLTGFYCGMRLIAPGFGISQGHRTSIQLASPAVQWSARVNAVAVLAILPAALVAWLLTL